MIARTISIPSEERRRYEAAGYEYLREDSRGGAIMQWTGDGTPPDPDRATCGRGCGCEACRWRVLQRLIGALKSLPPELRAQVGLQAVHEARA